MAETTPAPASPYSSLIVVLGVVIAVLAIYRLTSSDTTGPAASSSANSSTSSLRRLSTVPPFTLTERSGRQVTNRDLAGKIWIADFIYTTCPGPCPIITTNMAGLQDKLAADPRVMLVSFTVDPQNDTPGVLAKYADSYKADPNRWWFLTGPEKPLYSLIQNGFLQVVQDNTGQPPQEGQYKVTHSTYLALVDGEGNVRGVYDAVNATGRDDLLRDIKLLEAEGK